MSKELAKAYEPKEVEDRIYDFWMKGKYFHAEVDPKKKPYTIVIPPPNITGQLHLGHAMDETLQDTLIRWRRMQGYSALWLPGTDHASIATEAKIVEAMRKEGISKEDLGREKFLERAWAWKDQYGGRIVEQLKKLGSSCDWDRLRFTMDEGCNKAVNHVFKKLYDKGLIYRGERIINWCPHCKTSISDAEVEFEEKEGSFWHLRYPLADGTGYIELATTRPETMLGDTAVAVHPDDERYKALVGKTVILPLVNKEIPIIADTYVEQDFGTGVVKITPAHDPNDFEVGLRHKLPVINIMDDGGVINENGGKYAGMPALEARKQIVQDLDAGGYLIKIEPIKHNVGTCYRCGTVVEPRVSTQWFVKMEPLAKPAVDVVKNGEIRFIPDRMDKIYYNWMENIKDWCISRQLWWGHQIPAWYCDCGETIVSETEPKVCPKCGGTHLKRDEDTLDTWFSSALWPFSTLGWPEKTPELEYFYPTDTLVTGYDIIFFWVARMIFSGLEHMDAIPFNTVFYHGLIRDAQGRKMSKSLGNGVDPLDIIAEYGADEQSADSARRVLVWVMSNTLRLLHPFMPYITEEIWQTLPHDGEALIVAKWPEYDEALAFPAEAADMEKVMAVIRAVRVRRNEMNVPPSKKAHIYIETAQPAPYAEGSEFIVRLAYGSAVEIGASFAVEGAVTAVTDETKAQLPMYDHVDKAAEIARLTKELQNAQKQLDNVNAKLANEKFTSKAPQNVIDGVKANGEKLSAKIKLILETLESYR